MRWSAEEALRRALPYGLWRWTDPDGAVVETIFNRHYRAIATCVGGRAALARDPPKPLCRAAQYFYGDGFNTPMNGYPWREREARVAAENVLRDWGIDPVIAVACVAGVIREEERRERSRYGRASDEQLVELMVNAQRARGGRAIVAACRAELAARDRARDRTVIEFRARAAQSK